MEMPDSLASNLFAYRDAIWSFSVTLFFGICGSVCAIFMHPPEKPPLSSYEKKGTIFIGTIMALAFSSTIGLVINVPSGKSLTIAGSALIVSLSGRRIAKLLAKVPVLIFGKEDA